MLPPVVHPRPQLSNFAKAMLTRMSAGEVIEIGVARTVASLYEDYLREWERYERLHGEVK